MKDITPGASQPGMTPFLTSKIRIGSCKGPICYKLHQAGFHRSEIPQAKVNRVNAVNKWSKSKILTSDPNWNGSTTHLNPLVESRSMENFVHDRSKAYQYNFRAESLDPLRTLEPIDQPTKFHISRTLVSTATLKMTRRMNDLDLVQQGTFRRTEEIPINVNLYEKDDWNNTTSTSQKERDNKLFTLTNKSRASTAKISKIMTSSGYINPVEIEEKYQNTLREKKSMRSFVPASKIVTEAVDTRSLRNVNAIEKSTRYTTSQHSGVWELNKTENR